MGTYDPLLALAFLLFAAIAPSAAQEGARTYAALSLIGDTMTVVTYVGNTGAQLSQNRHEKVSVGSQLFDIAALNAVQLSLKNLDARTRVATFLGTSPALFAEQARLFDGQRVVLSPDLVAAMKKEATHLVLVTRHRGPAEIRTLEGHTGSGMLEGVGYYIDRTMRTMSYKTGGSAQGFIAPYVYLRISLVDLASAAIEADQFIRWSVMLSAASQGNESGGDPRDVLAGKHLKILEDSLAREVRRAVPSLVGRRERE